MENVRLGKAELVVSRIGMGCEPLGGSDWGVVDEKTVLAAVHRSLDLGVNLFDTADVYGLGLSEERLSKALDARRKDVVIVTKGGVGWSDDPAGGRARTFIDLSAGHIVSALEGSLRRLRLDCIPLYLLHWPDPKRPLIDALDALVRQRKAGKIQHIGLSNFSLTQVREACEVAPISAIEAQLNILDRHSGEEMASFARERDIGFLVYGVLAQGLLSGKYGPDAEFDGRDRRHRLGHFSRESLKKHQSLLACISDIGDNHNKEPSQVAISWALNNPGVTCAIVGAKTPEQVDKNCGAVGWKLSDEEINVIASWSEKTVESQ